MDQKKKKVLIIILVIAIIVSLVAGIMSFFRFGSDEVKTNVKTLEALPKPEITGGQRGELGIDKNINEVTIDKYLGRSDSVYRDMRMLEDPGNYEAIGGDRFLSGYIDGFEVVPLPYIIPVTGLPEKVGDTYTGTTLFYEKDGTYLANYKESMDIIEKYFPKDKVIFLMCGGGGYAGMMKNFLISMGWDADKIYNIGGYWYYEGKNSITVKKEVNGKVTYDFDKVPYHEIDFNKLTKSANYKEPTVKVSGLKINTDKVSLEEGTSFKLNAIILPNEATNKELKWTSNNTRVATVDASGLVKAVGPGAATIQAESVDGKKTAQCVVTVNKKVISTRIKVDDVSNEANELKKYDLKKLSDDFSAIYDDENNRLYRNEDYSVTDLWKEEYEKYMKRVNEAIQARITIANKLVDNKKSFIMLIYNKECEEREYSVVNNASKILTAKGYSFIEVGTETSDGDEILSKSKLNDGKTVYYGSPIAIIKEGKFYAKVDFDKDSIKSDDELKNWLSKYIEI